MAISPSALPVASSGSPGASPSEELTAEGGALPGGFLGMLGVLAVGTPSSEATAIALTMPATLPAANLGSVADARLALPPDSLSEALVADGSSIETMASPEAAAAAMAVMAQMLAATQAGVAQGLTPQPSVPGTQEETSGPTAGALTVLPSSIAAESPPSSEPALSATLAPLMPKAATAQSSVTVPAAAEPAAQDSGVDRPAGDAGKTPAFQSLTALLSGGPRTEAAAESKGSQAATSSAPLDGSRLSVMSTTLAMPGPSGGAATTDAQQPVLIREPVGTARWADSIGARLTMMATRGEQQGSLRLSPEHLGPVEVQIRLNDDKASVWFGAQHADTRAALQDALPRLRELFAAQGMQLGDAGVSREPPRQAATSAGSSAGDRGSASESSGIQELAVSLSSDRLARHEGLLDTYA